MIDERKAKRNENINHIQMGRNEENYKEKRPKRKKKRNLNNE